MTTKTIVRYLPPNPVIGARELAPDAFRSQGVFTQKKKLVWVKENGFWLETEEAGISAEALAWLKTQESEFRVEQQEIPDDEDPPTDNEEAVVEGEQPTGAGTPGVTTGTTTQSTARR